MKIILPKTFYDPMLIDTPLFFTAGPSLGGDDWQQRCAIGLQARMPNCHVAIPTIYESDHPLYQYKVSGNNSYFARQLFWERFYMRVAGIPAKKKMGCILFWLPCESKTNPRKDGQPYARDTYGELGEWRARMEFEHARVVVGSEAGFPGLDQINCNFEEMLGRDFPIYSTLESTVEAAIAMAEVGHC